MYVLLQTKSTDSTAQVVGVFNDELQARSELLTHCESLVTGKDQLEAVHQSTVEIRLYRRIVGWVSSSKELSSVLQLVEVSGSLAD